MGHVIVLQLLFTIATVLSLNLHFAPYNHQQLNTMELPVEQVFDSRDLLLAYAREHAISQGYAVTTIRSKADKNIYLGCDRGGVYHDRVNAPESAKWCCNSSPAYSIGGA